MENNQIIKKINMNSTGLEAIEFIWVFNAF